MEINNAPAEYIQKSLRADLNDADSMNTTYFSGRGEFLMLLEEKEENNSAISTTTTTTPSSNNNDCSNNGDQGDSSTKERRIRNIKGIVGLQDISTTTGTNKHKSKDSDTSEHHPNLCELRRMSIHSSCRRLGYGAKLVRACISHAQRSEFGGIKVVTGAWMEAAIGFYTKMGFEDKGRLEYVNGDGSSVTLAHLELIF